MGGDPLSGLQGHGVLSDPDGVGPWLEIYVYRTVVSGQTVPPVSAHASGNSSGHF